MPANRYTFMAAVGAVFAVFLFSNAIAETAWQRFRMPQAAIYLPHRNANLAAEIGSYYFGVGGYDLARAAQAYQKAVTINPNILWGHYQLARIHFMQGGHDAALAEINRELEANPENLRSLYVRGLIYGYRGNLDKAEEDFRRFTQWAPKEWAGYNDLAWILSKRGKHREAAEVLAVAFREVPDAEKNPWLWNALGVTRLNLVNYQGATAAFKRAQELAYGLTEAQWRAAYPGNNPTDAADGLVAFHGAIAENLRRSQ